MKPNDDFKKHLTNFFHFYGYQFNHQTDIVCPLLGVECQKAMFEPQNVVPLPLEFVPYQQYMMNIDLRVADEVDDLFANRKPLVVQDPFDLIHNVGKGMVQNKLNRFIAFSRRSYEMLH